MPEFFPPQEPSWSAGPPAWSSCCSTASTAGLVTWWSWSVGSSSWPCSTPSWTPASTPTRTRRCGPPSRTSCAALEMALGDSGQPRPTPGRWAPVRTRATASRRPRSWRTMIRVSSRPERRRTTRRRKRSSVRSKAEPLARVWAGHTVAHEDKDWRWLENETSHSLLLPAALRLLNRVDEAETQHGRHDC